MTAVRLSICVLAGLVGISTSPMARADVVLTFSDFNPTSVPIADIPATVTFALDGSQIHVTVDNQSLYHIKSMYINTDETLTGLAFSGLGSPQDEQWFIEGNTNQEQDSDGLGLFNWWVHFGDDYLLEPETVSTFTLDMTGTTALETLGSKLSIDSPNESVIAALRFQGFDNYAVGGTITADLGGGDPEPNPIPAPAGLPLALVAVGMLLGRRVISKQ